MVINDPAALANAVICAVIVCALMFYNVAVPGIALVLSSLLTCLY